MSALVLRKVTRNEQQLRYKIGGGLALPYWLQNEQGWLRLTFTEASVGHDMTGWRCDAGYLALSHAEPLLALLSSCPTLATGSDEETHWYWPWWNQQLSPELQGLFGSLTPAPVAASEGLLTLSLEAIVGERQTRSYIQLTPACLAALIDNKNWQSDNVPLPESLTLKIPMIIGELTLTLSEISSLGQGDVVLPEIQHFTPEGNGIVPCASLLLAGEIRQQAGTLAHFYLTDMETCDVSVTPDEFDYDNDNPHGEEWHDEQVENETSAFAPLPLSLSIRCGHLKLTLGELQRLNAGSIVLIENVTPGQAILCHGDYPLAKGELVDVEGQLGFQVTHILPDSKHVLNGDA